MLFAALIFQVVQVSDGQPYNDCMPAAFSRMVSDKPKFDVCSLVFNLKVRLGVLFYYYYSRCESIPVRLAFEKYHMPWKDIPKISSMVDLILASQ